MRSHCAIYVDVGYLLASAATRVTGTSLRSAVVISYPDLVTRLIDQAETRVGHGRDGYFINAEGWYGGDIDKLWLKTEIEGAYGSKPGQAEVQALWSHAIDPWFNLQSGVRIDTEPRTTARLAVGIEGLAPYWIEVDGAAFLSTRGDFTARFEAKHDLRITQRLLLQPPGQHDFALHATPGERVGPGLAKAAPGARARPLR